MQKTPTTVSCCLNRDFPVSAASPRCFGFSLYFQIRRLFLDIFGIYERLSNGTRRAGEASASHHGLWREVQAHPDLSQVLFGTKMATSFRGVGRKGWSPALEAPPQNSTSLCPVTCYSALPVPKWNFMLPRRILDFLDGSNAKEVWLRCPWFTLHSSRLWFFWSLRLTVSWGYLLRRSSSVQSDITISL